MTDINHDESITGNNGENNKSTSPQSYQQWVTAIADNPSDASRAPPSKQSDLEIRSHVNLWLVVSLSAAGLILVGSITFLVYRCLGGVGSASGSVTMERKCTEAPLNKPTSSGAQETRVQTLLLPYEDLQPNQQHLQPHHQQQTVTYIAFHAPIDSLGNTKVNDSEIPPFVTDTSNTILMQNSHGSSLKSPPSYGLLHSLPT